MKRPRPPKPNPIYVRALAAARKELAERKAALAELNRYERQLQFVVAALSAYLQEKP